MLKNHCRWGGARPRPFRPRPSCPSPVSPLARALSITKHHTWYLCPMDIHSTQTRSYNMARIKGKDTKPEMLVINNLLLFLNNISSLA